MKSTGKFLVGGNWKCNGTLDSVSKLISELNSAKIPDDIEVVVAPTFVHLQLAVDKLSPRYQVSAQNCWVGKQGAYTGEVGDLSSTLLATHCSTTAPACFIAYPLCGLLLPKPAHHPLELDHSLPPYCLCSSTHNALSASAATSYWKHGKSIT